jgi:uncharacterized protein YjbJ (UPF0337 family)
MGNGTTDRWKGKLQQLKGGLRRRAGEATGDAKASKKGHDEAIKGRGREALGRLKKAVGR